MPCDTTANVSDEKVCTCCRRTLSRTNFGINRATKDGLAYYCKPCAREKNRAHRMRDPEAQNRYAATYREKNRLALRERTKNVPLVKRRAYRAATRARCEEIVMEAKRAAGKCADCEERDLMLMDFDHLPERGPKVGNISKLMLSGRIKALIAELAKCEMVCIACHRKRTYARRLDAVTHPEV